jgi:hypothetical protein
MNSALILDGRPYADPTAEGRAQKWGEATWTNSTARTWAGCAESATPDRCGPPNPGTSHLAHREYRRPRRRPRHDSDRRRDRGADRRLPPRPPRQRRQAVLLHASVGPLCCGADSAACREHQGRRPRTRVRPHAGSPHPDQFLDQGSQRGGKDYRVLLDHQIGVGVVAVEFGHRSARRCGPPVWRRAGPARQRCESRAEVRRRSGTAVVARHGPRGPGTAVGGRPSREDLRFP